MKRTFLILGTLIVALFALAILVPPAHIHADAAQNTPVSYFVSVPPGPAHSLGSVPREKTLIITDVIVSSTADVTLSVSGEPGEPRILRAPLSGHLGLTSGLVVRGGADGRELFANHDQGSNLFVTITGVLR